MMYAFFLKITDKIQYKKKKVRKVKSGSSCNYSFKKKTTKENSQCEEYFIDCYCKNLNYTMKRTEKLSHLERMNSKNIIKIRNSMLSLLQHGKINIAYCIYMYHKVSLINFAQYFYREKTLERKIKLISDLNDVADFEEQERKRYENQQQREMRLKKINVCLAKHVDKNIHFSFYDKISKNLDFNGNKNAK